jgi:uncharacterized OsmC-like protein
MTSRVVYKGNLRTECEHIQSGDKIITDAPVDNNGKGEAFSPSDMLATSLASCMLTVVGIYCENHDLKLVNATAEVIKTMSSNPRRVSKIEITLDFSESQFDEKYDDIIRKVVETCPVQNSIHPDIELALQYEF